MNHDVPAANLDVNNNSRLAGIRQMAVVGPDLLHLSYSEI